ncbi:MAG: hypothetical protein L0211_14850 [Planctomycetaceae bacterium]|nr:hypothetical protein [Planctomycetaceae bacterium]
MTDRRPSVLLRAVGWIAITALVVLGSVELAVWFVMRSAPRAIHHPGILVNQDDDGRFVSNYELFDDPDQSGSQLSLRIRENTNPALVEASINELGDLELSLVPNSYGNARISLRATDPYGLYADTSLNVAVNGKPVVSPHPTEVVVDVGRSEVVLNLREFFSDPDEADSSLYFGIPRFAIWDPFAPPSSAFLFDDYDLDHNSGLLVLRLARGRVGTDTISLRASDSNGADSETTTIKVVVQPISDHAAK